MCWPCLARPVMIIVNHRLSSACGEVDLAALAVTPSATDAGSPPWRSNVAASHVQISEKSRYSVPRPKAGVWPRSDSRFVMLRPWHSGVPSRVGRRHRGMTSDIRISWVLPSRSRALRGGCGRLGSGSGWRVSTHLVSDPAREVGRQTVRPLVVRDGDRCWDDVPPMGEHLSHEIAGSSLRAAR